MASQMPATYRYACETRLVSGLGAIKLIPAELKTYKISKPALVVDAGLAHAGLLEQWLPEEVTSISPRILCPVNPGPAQVQEAAEKAKSVGCDGVVIIGGGSAICLGKGVGICLANSGHILDYEGMGKVPNPPVPTICVPTTAGSGSEVSRTLVLHEKGKPNEVIITAIGTEPRVALLDGEVLVSAPRKALLDAALDAISHACESLWSRNRSLFTDAMAEKALETFLTRLPAALNDRQPDALQEVLEASSAANLACGNSGLGLCHALNGAPDVPLPHGYVNGCLLSAVAAFNRPQMQPKHQKLIDRLPDLFREIGWSGKFGKGEVGKDRADLFVSASSGHFFRKNNVRESTDEDCYELLRHSGAVIEAPA